MLDFNELSAMQQEGIIKAADWFKNYDADNPTFFTVAGYAGTGKTTAISGLIEKLRGEYNNFHVLYAAYTGKAALVMRKYNKVDARTIHSLIYKLMPASAEQLKEYYEARQEAIKIGDQKLINKYQDLLDNAEKPMFRYNIDSDLRNAHLLVLDEVSMVNGEMLDDLLSFKCPIIALGDPGQLPPIDGTGALFSRAPDVLFTEIHRQASGNPIIEWSSKARQGIPLPITQEGEGDGVVLRKRVPLHKIPEDALTHEGLIITGKHVTRRAIIGRTRNILGHAGSVYPEVGERLICIRNEPQLGLWNGIFCTVVEVGNLTDTYINLHIETELQPGKTIEVKAYREPFELYFDKYAANRYAPWDKQDTQIFDFGYCITVHKAQGSQADRVTLIDDGMYKGWKPKERKQWEYTAITRAAERLEIYVTGK